MYDNTLPSQPANNSRVPEPHEDSPQLVTGILDIGDNRAFIRTGGYLPGPHDAHVPPGLVREHGLRRGDTVTGRIRPAGHGEKLAPLVQIDTINGQHPRHARSRAVFAELVPLYPNERIRLETESHALTTRVADLLMPVGKGQRALIVAPPKAGKTSVLAAIAHGIAKNHPECHLMLVLVGERPEEVTDLARTVPGEIIAATFDRPPREHTALAELAIERAKRLVELGRDVVVMLDSLTRLGRAYNLTAPASGRILSGGVDSTALVPPKRFLGAARNIENGGSLTIFATALVETGSAGDTLIFEEYKGTSNAELRLDSKIASKRVYPAVDIGQSSTRKEELLLTAGELTATRALRRTLGGRDTHQALDMLLDGLRKTHTNSEFLTRVTPAPRQQLITTPASPAQQDR
ncbi:MAG TPA: transcription termination factor Rho [Pseudonocardiaceae bacterium]|nr:transcription termination factor Rho [Pseudonocardiaceae bacterium]